jgi:hypothetical protein
MVFYFKEKGSASTAVALPQSGRRLDVIPNWTTELVTTKKENRKHPSYEWKLHYWKLVRELVFVMNDA